MRVTGSCSFFDRSEEQKRDVVRTHGQRDRLCDTRLVLLSPHLVDVEHGCGGGVDHTATFVGHIIGGTELGKIEFTSSADGDRLNKTATQRPRDSGPTQTSKAPPEDSSRQKSPGFGAAATIGIGVHSKP